MVAPWHLPAVLAVHHVFTGGRIIKTKDQQSAGEAFEQHVAECFGQAGEEQHIGGGKVAGQFFSAQRASEAGKTKSRFQRRPIRTIADDHAMTAPVRQFFQRLQRKWQVFLRG